MHTALDNLESSFRTIQSRITLTPDELAHWVGVLEHLEPSERHATALKLVRLAQRLRQVEPVNSNEAISQLSLLTSAAVHSREIADALFKAAQLR